MPTENNHGGRWLSYKLNLAENRKLKDANEKLYTENGNLTEKNHSLVEENLKLMKKLEDSKSVENETIRLKVESLENELKKKRNEVEDLQKEVRLQKAKLTYQRRDLSNMNDSMIKLYSAAGVAMESLGGQVPIFHLMMDWNNHTSILNQFCKELQEKTKKLQNGHQQMHNELVQLIKNNELIVESFERKLWKGGADLDILRKDFEDEKKKSHQQHQLIRKLKICIKKLYSAAGTVLEGLGEDVPSVESLEEGGLPLEQFCHILKEKFAGWQVDHQSLHNRLDGKLQKSGAGLEILRKYLEDEKKKSLQQHQHLRELKGCLKRLYLAAGTVLEGLGENVPPFESWEEGGMMSLEQFCNSLQGKFSGWKEDHQLIHNRLEEEVRKGGANLDILRKDFDDEKKKSLQQQELLRELKSSIKTLYLAGGTVLEGLGEDVPSFESLEEEGSLMTLDQFCHILKEKFSGWQLDHQLLHNRLQETLNMMEDLVEQTSCDEYFSTVQNGEQAEESVSEVVPPTNVSSPSTTPSHPQIELPKGSDGTVEGVEPNQRNSSKKSNSGNDSYNENFPWTQLDFRKFVCGQCGDTFCRLAHSSTKLKTVVIDRSRVLLLQESDDDATRKRRSESQSKADDGSESKKRKSS